MQFEDIQIKLKNFFKARASTPLLDTKSRIKNRVLNAFEQQMETEKRSFFFRFRIPASAGFAFIMGIVFITQKATFNETIKAGEIQAQFGPVEIIRGKESFLVKDSADVFVGDEIKVGNRGRAKITLTDQSIASVGNKTHFKITDKDALFLTKGQLNNEVFRGVEIATDRGLVKSNSGSDFEIIVSETGEAQIHPQKNSLQVFDLQNGSLSLKAGEAITLKSDTHLSQKSIPTDLELSNNQIASIYSKLIIARTKVLTSIEKTLAGNKETARKDILSAERTFLSIAQVLKSSRELEIARRKNIKNLKVDEIYSLLKDKSNEEELLKEVEAIETLFAILAQNKGKIGFAPQKSGVTSFDRFQLLQNLAQLGTPDQAESIGFLSQKYSVAFLRKIQNEALIIDQISLLNTEIEKLPKTKTAQKFLTKTKELFHPTLQLILEEAIIHKFTKQI